MLHSLMCRPLEVHVQCSHSFVSQVQAQRDNSGRLLAELSTGAHFEAGLCTQLALKTLRQATSQESQLQPFNIYKQIRILLF